ncbi:MAG: hypothetical protein U0K68_13320 [Agathobacter sp.]|nr:hypothetical protein [Agathobacter sp.]
MGKSRIIIRVIITILFLTSLYFVEAGFCGGRVVAKYNNGFGTLDMKHYNPDIVQKVLSSMNHKGIEVYRQYYIMDYIFIIFFGAFQLMIINDVFWFNKNKIISIIIYGAPILRGICDIIENTIILLTLHTYPRINELAISISSRFTSIKLMSIKVWIMLTAIGIAIGMVYRLKGTK